MNPNAGKRDDEPAYSLEPKPRRWLSWLAQITVFSVVFVLLIRFLSMMAEFVEQLFYRLYVD